jgi:hypothetical protein
MPKLRESIVLGTDLNIVREVRDGSAIPTEDSNTISKVEAILKKGSVRYKLNSTDNSSNVSLPDVDWNITLSFGDQDFELGDYQITLVLFDSVNDDGIPLEPFAARVKSV